MSRRSTRRVMQRRTGRAMGALSVVAFAAFGPTGPGLVATATAEVGVAASVSGPARLAAAELAAAELGTATAVSAPTDTTAGTATTVPPTAPEGNGIPGTVLAAYRAAEATLAGSAPSCHLPWTLVAGIGRVESGHASGGRVDDAGTTRGDILGPRLDGSMAGTATIRDTDRGVLDGDASFDRAVGPMQFIPGTWKSYAKDGNRDGLASPHNVFDAALAAGSYLCAGGGDLSQPAAQRAALLRYNRSDSYGALVLRWAAAYGAGVAVLPGQAGQVPPTTPTPPAQVPAPAAGPLDPATSAALAAPAPTVTGTVASESAADEVVVTTTATTTTTTPTTTTPTTTTPATTATSTTPTTTTPAPVTTTTPTTTTKPTTTKPTTTEPTTTEPTTTEPTTTEPTTSTGVTPSSIVTSTSSRGATDTTTSGAAAPTSTTPPEEDEETSSATGTSSEEGDASPEDASTEEASSSAEGSEDGVS